MRGQENLAPSRDRISRQIVKKVLYIVYDYHPISINNASNIITLELSMYYVYANFLFIEITVLAQYDSGVALLCILSIICMFLQYVFHSSVMKRFIFKIDYTLYIYLKI